MIESIDLKEYFLILLLWGVSSQSYTTIILTVVPFLSLGISQILRLALLWEEG